MQWTSAPNIAGAPLPQRARGYWGARLRATLEGLERLLEAERAQLPPWLAVGFGSVWVSNNGSGNVARIDPKTTKGVATIPTQTRPDGIAVGDGAVWVTAY